MPFYLFSRHALKGKQGTGNEGGHYPVDLDPIEKRNKYEEYENRERKTHEEKMITAFLI